MLANQGLWREELIGECNDDDDIDDDFTYYHDDDDDDVDRSHDGELGS